MSDFHLDNDTVDAQLAHAQQAAPAEVERCLARARRGAGLTPEEMAVLWFASHIDGEVLYEVAAAAHSQQRRQLETFSPLYMTNTCDAECHMCGMRRDNRALTRETASIPDVVEQLRILSRRGMHAVALLTGEYRTANRPWALHYVNEALRETQAMRFNHVLINVGSIDEPEFATLLAGIARHADGAVQAKLTMCTFQETYSRTTYAKFMGTDPDNPRADFERRLTNFDRAYRAGMRVANPGILVGLNTDLAFEMTALTLHARHLLDLGMEVYLSVPRLRQIAGSRNQRGASDEQFVRLVSLLSLGLPTCKIVITTREDSAMQAKLAPIVTVISAGSAAVTPYTETGAHFPLETSQFEVLDQRPFEAVLREHRPADNARIQNFDPPEASVGN
jgi:2-iminoacetate synthase